MKFVEDPRVVFGTKDGPNPDRALMRGAFAGLFTSSPSKDIEPSFVVEQRVPSIRVRGYSASIDGGMWVSPGYLSMSLFQYAWLYVRAAARLWRDPIPRAWVRK